VGYAARAVFALDAWPLVRAPAIVSDYASETVFGGIAGQLFRWCEVNRVARPAAALRLTSSPDYREHRIEISETARWADGARVTADDYARGLWHVIGLRAPASNRLGHLIDVGVERTRRTSEPEARTLVIRTADPDLQVANKLAHPAFAPRRPRSLCDEGHDAGGPFTIRSWSQRAIELARKPPPECEIEFRPIHDPEEAVASFVRGELHATCPASFPSALIQASDGRFRRAVSTTYFALVPVSEQARQMGLLRMIARHLGLGWIPSQLNAVLSPVWGFSDMTLDGGQRPARVRSADADDICGIKGTPIKFAYDEFHPNREIVEAIVQKIGPNVRCQIVADDFYRPSANYDVKLMVLCNSPSYRMDIYRRLSGAEELSDTIAREAYKSAVRQYDAAAREFDRQSTVKKLDDLLQEHLPVLPLFKLNQHYLSRTTHPFFSWGRGWS
jgi:hypothetical protein